MPAGWRPRPSPDEKSHRRSSRSRAFSYVVEFASSRVRCEGERRPSPEVPILLGNSAFPFELNWNGDVSIRRLTLPQVERDFYREYAVAIGMALCTAVDSGREPIEGVVERRLLRRFQLAGFAFTE